MYKVIQDKHKYVFNQFKNRKENPYALNVYWTFLELLQDNQKYYDFIINGSGLWVVISNKIGLYSVFKLGEGYPKYKDLTWEEAKILIKSSKSTFYTKVSGGDMSSYECSKRNTTLNPDIYKHLINEEDVMKYLRYFIMFDLL